MRLGTKTKNTRKHSPLSVPMTSYFWAKKELMISFWAPPQSICGTKKLSGQLSNLMIDRCETIFFFLGGGRFELSNLMIDCPETNTYL